MKTKDLLVVETEKARKQTEKENIEIIPLLEAENASMAFQLLEKDIRIETLESEVSTLTFLLMEKEVI